MIWQSHALAAGLLRQADEIRNLNPVQAEEELPVDLSVQVTYLDPGGVVFVEDATGGTFLRMTPALSQIRDQLKVRDRLRVLGFTFPGLYVPGVMATRIEILGSAELTEAEEIDVATLRSGTRHYERARLRGVLLHMRVADENLTMLRLGVGDDEVEVRVDAVRESVAEWLGAEIEVAGLIAGFVNERRQLLNVHLRVQNWSGIRLLHPAQDVEQLPHKSFAELKTFQSDSLQERVRVSGVLLWQQSPQIMFLRDAMGSELALKVILGDRIEAIPIGSEVELAGFVRADAVRVYLDHAQLLEQSPQQQSPLPVDVALSKLNDQAVDADWLRIEGEVTGAWNTKNGVELLLKSERPRVRIIVPAGSFTPPAAGSWIEVNGICEVEEVSSMRFRQVAEALRIWAPSADALRILRAAPFWTTTRLVTLSAILLGFILLALLWVVLLRRTVQRQAERLQKQAAETAMIEERGRIARDFHDTLAQDLVGLALRLDAAVTLPLDDTSKNLIQTVRRMLRRMQEEMRVLLYQLHEPAPQNLRLQLEQLVADHTLPECAPPELHVDPALPLLPPADQHHVMMIVREALSNAIRHAPKAGIKLNANMNGECLILEVMDSGPGMPTVNVPDGHYGCENMRERARRIRAKIEWLSNPSEGTTVRLCYPIAS